MPLSPFSAWNGFTLTADALITPEGEAFTPAELLQVRWIRRELEAELRRLRAVQPLGVVLTLEELAKLREIVNLFEAKLPERAAGTLRPGRRRNN